MQGGDISNEVERVPRTLVVWEGYLATRPPQKRSLIARTSSPRKLVAAYELNIKALDLMWDRAWRAGWRFEIITFLGEAAARAIQEHMEGTFWDFGTVIATTPERLAREITHFPDIVCVCDPDPNHFLTYGAKGLHVTAEHPKFWS